MKGRLLLSSTIYFGRWVWVESKVVAGCHIYYLIIYVGFILVMYVNLYCKLFCLSQTSKENVNYYFSQLLIEFEFIEKLM